MACHVTTFSRHHQLVDSGLMKNQTYTQRSALVFPFQKINRPIPNAMHQHIFAKMINYFTGLKSKPHLSTLQCFSASIEQSISITFSDQQRPMNPGLIKNQTYTQCSALVFPFQKRNTLTHKPVHQRIFAKKINYLTGFKRKLDPCTLQCISASIEQSTFTSLTNNPLHITDKIIRCISSCRGVFRNCAGGGGKPYFSAD